MNASRHHITKRRERKRGESLILRLAHLGILSAIALLLTTTIGFAQVGMVESFQKISKTDGGFLGNPDAVDLWGVSSTFVGDIDGDHVPDLAIGAPRADEGGTAQGAVWLLFLHPNGTVKSHQKISSTSGGFTGDLDDEDFFGVGVAGVGDLDGDGIPDLAVGAPGDDDGGIQRGAIWILHLHPNGTVKTHQKISDDAGEFTGDLGDNEIFGFAVTAVGDLDSDGIPDLAVGAPGNSDGGANRGAVWVLFFNASGMVKNHQKISSTTGGFTGTLDDADLFGVSVATIGELDSDGIPDLAVGAMLDDDGGSGKGAVWVLFMESNGMVKFHQKISDQAGNFTGQFNDGEIFGRSVAAVGDLNGDGISDLVVGAPGDDDGGTQKGAVWVLFMDRTGMIKFHQKISEETGHFTGTLNVNDELGSSVAGGQDLNEDNIPDLAVGAPHTTDDGAIWIFHMNGMNE